MNNFTINDSNSSIPIPTLNEHNLFAIILSILVFIVLIIGLIGNGLVIYVILNYGRLKTITNTYLLHLALSDLVFLSGVPFFISSIITRSWIFGGFMCKIFFLTQGVNQYTAILILALLSFDRYLAVCHSAKSIMWRSRVNPNLLLTLVWILSFFLMLPIIIFTTVECKIILPVSQSRSIYLIYIAYTAIITFFLPILSMIYFHLRIIYRIHNNVPKQHRRSLTSMRTRRKVTVLVLSVISVHIICFSPYWIFQIFTTSELLPQTSRILIPTSTITQSLLFVNSSANPILYAFISELFRTSFKRAFYCYLSTNNQQIVIRENTVIKRNNISTINNNINDYPQPNRITTISRNCNQNLTVQTRPSDLSNRQNRFLSLAPTASIFISETSIAPDA